MQIVYPYKLQAHIKLIYKTAHSCEVFTLSYIHTDLLCKPTHQN